MAYFTLAVAALCAARAVIRAILVRRGRGGADGVIENSSLTIGLLG